MNEQLGLASGAAIEVNALSETIKPLLAGKSPEVIRAVLGELMGEMIGDGRAPEECARQMKPLRFRRGWHPITRQ
jgi:hypothetical protein